MITDPISDMLTRIRNAQAVRKPELSLPYSSVKFHIAKILEKEGYVGGVAKTTEAKFPQLRIALKYNNNRGAIQSIKRVSKPGRRVYSKANEL